MIDPESLTSDDLLAVKAELARRRMQDFVQWTYPEYSCQWFHAELCRQLDRWIAGDIDRLMVFMPPRHGKSELVSRRLPAYLLGRLPDDQIIAASYSADLASRMNRDCQRIIDSPQYDQLFPDTRLQSPGSRNKGSAGNYIRTNDLFEVVGRKGAYRSAGVGGGITGMGARWIIVDDPVKNAEEAESPTYRAKMWEWYKTTLRTRLEDRGRILVTLTRWHHDDLAGRLLELAEDDREADQWEVVRFPAIAEPGAQDYDKRRPGQALWPDRYPLKELKKHRAAGLRAFGSLYQQDPKPREGGMFDRTIPQILDILPKNVVSSVRYWDRAGTAGGGDWTVGLKMCKLDDGRFLVADIIRKQLGPFGVEKLILSTAALDGISTDVVIEEDPGQAGKFEAAHYVRLLSGFTVSRAPARENKITRARPFASQWEAGAVLLLRATWNKPFLDESENFPHGKHDDQIDAGGGAFRHLTEKMGVIEKLRALTG